MPVDCTDADRKGGDMTVSVGPPPPAAQGTTLPGAAIISRILLLLIVASGAGIVYGAVVKATQGFCPGG